MMIWWEDIFYEAFPSRVKLWDRVFISRAVPASTPPSNQRTQNVHTLVIVQQCVETLRSRKQTWLIFVTINILTLYLEFASNLQSSIVEVCKNSARGELLSDLHCNGATEAQVGFTTNRELFCTVEMFRTVPVVMAFSLSSFVICSVTNVTKDWGNLSCLALLDNWRSWLYLHNMKHFHIADPVMRCASGHACLHYWQRSFPCACFTNAFVFPFHACVHFIIAVLVAWSARHSDHGQNVIR